MFGRRKDPEPVEKPVYVVDRANKKLGVQALLNKRYAEGYDLVSVTSDEAWGTSVTSVYIFKLRSAD